MGTLLLKQEKSLQNLLLLLQILFMYPLGSEAPLLFVHLASLTLKPRWYFDGVYRMCFSERSFVYFFLHSSWLESLDSSFRKKCLSVSCDIQHEVLVKWSHAFVMLIYKDIHVLYLLFEVHHHPISVYQSTTKYLQWESSHPSSPPELISIAFQSQCRNNSVRSAAPLSISSQPPPPSIYYTSAHTLWFNPANWLNVLPFTKVGKNIPCQLTEQVAFLCHLEFRKKCWQSLPHKVTA